MLYVTIKVNIFALNSGFISIPNRYQLKDWLANLLKKMFRRLPLLISRFSSATNQLTPPINLTPIVKLEPLQTRSPVWTQVRGFKDKEVLRIRCPDCYFKKIDERWWVLCHSHPRHKQRQKIEDIRRQWIVTHITRTGRPFRKHFQYPGHDL